MAIIHKATLSPSKLELLTSYVAGWPELSEHVQGDLEQVGAYRFDDPDGEVGIETHILTSSADAVLQVPLVYRNDEVPGANEALLGTMEHSVLGTRWVYDACFDVVYLGELVRTILTGDKEAAEIVETTDGKVPRATSVQVRGSGDLDESVSISEDAMASRDGAQTVVDIGEYVLMIPHVLDDDAAATELALSGVWKGRSIGMSLARMVRSGS